MISVGCRCVCGVRRSTPSAQWDLQSPVMEFRRLVSWWRPLGHLPTLADLRSKCLLPGSFTCFIRQCSLVSVKEF